MKLLFLNSFYPPHVGGGAELILQRSVEGFQQRGHEVCVLVTGPAAGLVQEQVNGVRVYRAGLKNLYWPLTQQRPGPLARFGWHFRDQYNKSMRTPLREVLQRERPDLVVCHNLSGWSVSAWDEIRASGTPLVQVLHDMYLLCPKNTLFKKGQSCQKLCGSCAALRRPHAAHSAQVDAVVGVSRYLLETIRDKGYFQGVPAQVIHNSSLIDGNHEARPPSPAGNPLRFGYLGTLSENKGVGWLIEQFQRLSLNATLTIAGKGQLAYEEQLKAMADPSRVSFVGYQRPQDFFNSIDVFVVPSLWAEPFGMVAVEACAFQKPVIASRMGGLPEIVRDGVNGLLCNPADRDSLGRALQRLHDDAELRQRLSLLSRSAVAPLLSLEPMLDDYHRLFEQVLGQARHGAACTLHPAQTQLSN
ncbi:glycosyltransferase family 4 protein [Pseudomonas rhizoryzae]|uniref:glycosyltransferase family 4 protein n=1 Tax=Pseudomonas rhizoryzae TaxID=2571129 RepID=UPI0007373A3D|nr:glycosyltransferase family 4 protein [Pseudomonas rhizoryzae]KTT30352.1 glycosyl transferase family 1 [Pseudomonas psychrotolerans]KTT36771.1 glycosyl transferase family 1 [Pseudomonas psychrotolerans]KTT77706.1 glycosyl transferase family 1 [Pseudomonas psychrotolerans]